MAVTTRAELVVVLANLGIMGAAREGVLDALFAQGTAVPEATATVFGTVKKAATQAAVPAQTVTDIATAQTSITTLVTKINALIAGQKTAAQMA